MEQRKSNPGVKTQGTLDGVIKPVRKYKEFMREEVLHSVTQFVACDGQVGIVNMFMSRVLWYLLCWKALAIPDKVLFRNCLVAMRPRTTDKDLPTSHDVKVHLHNECVGWLKELKKDIIVSCNTFESTR